jgi:hypothetical protein
MFFSAGLTLRRALCHGAGEFGGSMAFFLLKAFTAEIDYRYWTVLGGPCIIGPIKHPSSV